jgi:hypothetical protein
MNGTGLDTELYIQKIFNSLTQHIPWYMIQTLDPNLQIVWDLSKQSNIDADANRDKLSSYSIIQVGESNKAKFENYHNLFNSDSKSENKQEEEFCPPPPMLVRCSNIGYDINWIINIIKAKTYNKDYKRIYQLYNRICIESHSIPYSILYRLSKDNLKYISQKRYWLEATRQKKELYHIFFKSYSSCANIPRDIFETIFIYLFKI